MRNNDIHNPKQKHTIKYIIPIGSLCHIAYLFKRNNLKLTSYPFDWIFSNLHNVIHALKDDFKTFLDKSKYIDIEPKKCGHIIYHPQMFNHHNPLMNEPDYDYFVRCINRLKKTIKTPELKLVAVIFTNFIDNITTTFTDYIIKMNHKLKKHITNYRLLCIVHYSNRPTNHYHLTTHKNIDFLEISTISISNGVEFVHPLDNDYLDKLIKDIYDFELIPINNSLHN